MEAREEINCNSEECGPDQKTNFFLLSLRQSSFCSFAPRTSGRPAGPQVQFVCSFGPARTAHPFLFRDLKEGTLCERQEFIVMNGRWLQTTNRSNNLFLFDHSRKKRIKLAGWSWKWVRPSGTNSRRKWTAGERRTEKTRPSFVTYLKSRRSRSNPLSFFENPKSALNNAGISASLTI